MSVSSLMEDVMACTQYLPAAGGTVAVGEFDERDHAEVLSFLAERPVHTICMAGLIRDNGLVSEHHRGTFYGCRNSAGRLEGVALIGHHTLLEARTLRALREFALVAQTSPRTHMIMGELDAVSEFWNAYADEGRPMRRACRELLFELRRAADVGAGVEELRLATPEDLELIVPLHAGLAEAESGVNPLDSDPEGFRRRCLRRAEQGRTWVVVRDGRLDFKAEVQADTPEVVYVEGVYVAPAERGTNYGRRCMSEMCRRLLARARVVSLLAGEENARAHAFYRSCGFQMRGLYDTIYLHND